MTFYETCLATYVPACLQKPGEQVWAKMLRGWSKQQRDRLTTLLRNSPDLARQLIRALLGSQYLLESCIRDPDLLFHWLLTDIPFTPLDPAKIAATVETICANALPASPATEELDSVLRRLRRRLMTALYWRDLNDLADFDEVSRAMTTMAEIFVQRALDYHYHKLGNKHGFPTGKDSRQPQTLLVIGMGKLGGGELNVSSDIDLMFAFPEEGMTKHKTAAIDNQTFFTRLSQRLIKTLDGHTADGFVFRVDMRLRPWGQSGPLASNFVALENYYQTQGRDWERYAAIKARVIATARLSADAVVQSPQQLSGWSDGQKAIDDWYKILRPFIYRKYTDYSTVDSLRQLKAMIVQEVRRKGLEDDIKLGAGGIREIEFIAQSFQLLRGGRDSRLRERQLLSVLKQLEKPEYLDREVVEGLQQAYLFLRKTEHGIQAFQDAQTQRLPVEQPAANILAWVMGFESREDFLAALARHRWFVTSIFRKVFTDTESRPQHKVRVLPEWQSFWQQPVVELTPFLQAQGFTDTEGAIGKIKAFKHSGKVQRLSASARARLDQLMPQLLQVIGDGSAGSEVSGDVALSRLLAWLETIVNRTSYLLLLLENPSVLKLLTKLFAASSWVAGTMAHMPSLLDELLHPDTLFALPEKHGLRDELRQRLLRLEPNDIEAQLETLRYFSLAHSLHVAACEVAGALPLMKVSDYLTFIAEVILEQVLQLAMTALASRHGYPGDVDDQHPGFLLVGYGKLGGIEMSYSSDLDLVFIYRADPSGMTNGERPLDNQTWYTRLGQKIIHILNARTLSGELYQVDMRLRPSGNSGLLVSSMSAYERYQQQQAWIWEHQALVRARPVAGDQQLAEEFISLRQRLLCQPRQEDELRSAVIDMRNKMRNHLGATPQKGANPSESIGFHLKHDRGGIVDIEFMVQYAVLAWSCREPALAQWTDNIRILESLQQYGFIEAEQASRLNTIYQSYRSYQHRLALQEEKTDVVADELFADERKQVMAMWERLLEPKSGEKST